MCPRCERPVERCQCKQTARQVPIPAGDRILVSRETKGRKGKVVTLVSGLPLGPLELATLSKELKAACGSGGTVKDGVVEIQGEHRDRLVTELERRGYAVKRSG